MALGLLDGRRISKFGLTGNENVLYFGSGFSSMAHRLARSLTKRGGRLTVLDVPRLVLAKEKPIERGPSAFEIAALTSDTYDLVFIDTALHGVELCKRAETVGALSLALRGDGRLIVRESIEFAHGLPLHVLIDLMADSGLKEVAFKISGLPLRGRAYTGVFRKAEIALASSKVELHPKSLSVRRPDYAL